MLIVQIYYSSFGYVSAFGIQLSGNSDRFNIDKAVFHVNEGLSFFKPCQSEPGLCGNETFEIISDPRIDLSGLLVHCIILQSCQTLDQSVT